MAIRILDVLNFSNLRNPYGDSGVRLQKELIDHVIQRRPDFFFYLLIPRELEGPLRPLFTNPNVQLLPSSCLSRQQGGAYHFDIRELSALLDLHRIDVDVLFLNQPELTAGFLHYFNKVHFFDIHSVGYIHWMDWKRSDNVKNRWNAPGNLAIMSGILLAEATGCNSEYGKEKILKEAARWLNADALNEVSEKLLVLRPGVNVREILPTRAKKVSRIKTIIAPYRTQKYTGFKSLVKIHLANLWKKRQDFRLILTNPSDYDYVKKYHGRYPFVEVRQLSRREYIETLWKADIVVGCHNGASQWSLAMVEAMTAECLPLLNSESFFKEMILDALPENRSNLNLEPYFYYRANFARKLNYLLDNLEEERTTFRPIAQVLRRYYDWRNRIEDWIRLFERADGAARPLKSESRIARKIDALLYTNGACSKETILRHLGWHSKSRHISWTRYRKHLRQNYWEDSSSPTVLFARRT
jgi:hypothetical protein